MSEPESASLAAPDFVEAFESWRVWAVVRDKDGYRLASVVKSSVWPPGEPLAAGCLRNSPLLARLRRRSAHTAPDQRCECGIYAASLSTLGPYLRDPVGNGALARVLGRVSLWGTVIECERGFRASRAYPARIFVPVDSPLQRGHRWDALIAGLETYGVPVEPLPARCAEAAAALERQQLASR
jgi:hypothetical protein